MRPPAGEHRVYKIDDDHQRRAGRARRPLSEILRKMRPNVCWRRGGVGAGAEGGRTSDLRVGPDAPEAPTVSPEAPSAPPEAPTVGPVAPSWREIGFVIELRRILSSLLTDIVDVVDGVDRSVPNHMR